MSIHEKIFYPLKNILIRGLLFIIQRNEFFNQETPLIREGLLAPSHTSLIIHPGLKLSD
jgi:hypothetical protein